MIYGYDQSSQCVFVLATGADVALIWDQATDEETDRIGRVIAAALNADAAQPSLSELVQMAEDAIQGSAQ